MSLCVNVPMCVSIPICNSPCIFVSPCCLSALPVSFHCCCQPDSVLSHVYRQRPCSTFPRNLQKITGIGPSKAKELINKNITFDDLINNNNNVLDNLTHHQKLGVKYYYDVLKPIPHEIIQEVEKYLNKFDFKFNICGSYRRKKKTSGDIDVLIEKENKSLKEIIHILTKKKFLVDHLTEDGSTKYMGFCKIKNSHHMRIDIRLIPKESYPFALLYFTGSKKTNTMMRNQAIKLGFKLNEYSLVKTNVPLHSDNNFDKSKMTRTDIPVYFDSEEMIFECLNLNYIKPEDR